MKKKTKNNLIKGGIAGAIGAAAIGGAAYLLSNKKARQKIGKVVKDFGKRGEKELDKVLKSVDSAKKDSEKKVKRVIGEVKKKKKMLEV
jgi:hypothetical protein